MKHLVVLAVAAISSSLTGARSPEFSEAPELSSAADRANSKAYLVCYENPDYSGDEVRLLEYAPYLNLYNFNNRARSCCIHGIWLLYDGYNYNSDPADRLRNMYLGWGENFCESFGSSFSAVASSARFVGPPDGYKYSTLNLFEYDYFSGREDYHYSDFPVMLSLYKVNSIIVTGCDPWTLYDGTHYRGRSVCVYPGDRHQCYPGFYKSRYNLDSHGIARYVKSARVGCFSSYTIVGDSVIKADTGSYFRIATDDAAASGGSEVFGLRKEPR